MTLPKVGKPLQVNVSHRHKPPSSCANPILRKIADAILYSIWKCFQSGISRQAIRYGDDMHSGTKHHTQHTAAHAASLRSMTTRMLGLLSAIMLSVGMAACATLPDVRDLSRQLEPASTPTVATPKGALPPAKAESLLAQRLHNARKTDLKALAALEEAATGSPLIAGNKVTLLFDGPATINAMMTAIAGAKDHINFVTYIFDED